jgi:tetratricopeptide (TPR) repeat protein
MGNKTPKACGKLNCVAKEEQTFNFPKDVASGRKISAPRAQNAHLIWLDSNINDNSPDSRDTITHLQQLRYIVNTINIFTDGEECIQFIESIGNEKACLIISGSLSQYIVPRVHGMSQVDSIFIFCFNKGHYKQWAKKWPKIKGVFTRISSICEILKQKTQECEQNPVSISFMATDSDNAKKDLNQLDPSFMYTQILKEILLTINFEEKHFADFIKYCRDIFAENEDELKKAEELQKTYRDQTPIWWYTSECFLYSMLNRALRRMDVDIIIKMGFFIDDLHRHIDQLHKEQFDSQNSTTSFTVYRGQGMSESEFEQMSKTKGGLISFNNFLSTSKNCDVSLDFAYRPVLNPNLVGIFFIMTIDPAKSTTPFASISDVSYFKDKEDEVLFAMHTVFRICEITPMDEDLPIFQVELTLTNDNDKDLCVLTDHIREETFLDVEGWYRLGLLLLKVGQFDKAEEVYEILLEEATNEGAKALIYHQIGSVKNHQGEYEEAIKFFEKDLEISQKILPKDHPDLISSYNNIGTVHFNMGEYSKALSQYKKCLEIRRQSLPPDHLDLAASYNNIGVMYKNMGEYSKALLSHENALAIQQRSLPPNHPDLAASYGNIGLTYMHLGEYSNALSFLEKTVEIQRQSLPSNHPHLAYSYNNIALVYENQGNYSEGASFYEHAVSIGQHSLPSNHPDMQMYRRNLDRIKNKL